jgi:hypothetical protein
MRVIVYVEGRSDITAMEILLGPLLEQKRREGTRIDFFDAPEGDKKKSVLEKVPKKAVNTICNEPDSLVVAMPDLYPRNKGFPHQTFEELEKGIRRNFDAALHAKGKTDDVRLRERFKVFCFMHDLEALVLASEQGLRSRLDARTLAVTWRLPVEDQDHNRPPKRVVEELFEKHGQSYKDTVDAPIILSQSRYQDIADRCPQCFKPFVDFLERL